MFDTGGDCEHSINLDRKLSLPDIVKTTQQTNMVLWSKQTRTIVAKELTVQWEENCDEAHQSKILNYTDLLTDFREKG